LKNSTGVGGNNRKNVGDVETPPLLLDYGIKKNNVIKLNA
jgi:hypothetical protein